MNILVTGANGQLGQCIRDRVETRDQGENKWFWTDVSGVEGRKCDYLDITDEDAVKKYFVDNAISVCVNCAAYTNVDKAEENEEQARKLNADAPKYLADACNIHGTKLIHISTDYVFNGTSFIPLTEDRATFPVSVYGKTKLEGEQNIINSGCKYLIFRTAWLYSEYGNNFVKTMCKLFHEGKSVKVVYDQIGTPTYARDLASHITYIIENNELNANGIFHFTNHGVCSWFDFAKFILDRMKVYDRHLDTPGVAPFVIPVSTKEYYQDKKHAERPFYSVLSKEKIMKHYRLCLLLDWMTQVDRCVHNIVCETYLKNEK